MSFTARIKAARHALVVGMATSVVLLASASTAFAARGDNLGENAKELVMSWIEPIFYLVVAGLSVFLFAKRKFPELLAFLLVGAIVAGPVFNPEGTKDLLLGISNTVSGSK